MNCTDNTLSATWIDADGSGIPLQSFYTSTFDGDDEEPIGIGYQGVRFFHVNGFRPQKANMYTIRVSTWRNRPRATTARSRYPTSSRVRTPTEVRKCGSQKCWYVRAPNQVRYMRIKSLLLLCSADSHVRAKSIRGGRARGRRHRCGALR